MTLTKEEAAEKRGIDYRVFAGKATRGEVLRGLELRRKRDAAEAKREGTMVLVTASRCLVGRCVHYPGKGWRFLPSVSNHKPSTRYWPEANDCIPAWAMKISDEMLTAREWERIREQHADKAG